MNICMALYINIQYSSCVCTEPFPPPADVQLVEENNTHLGFSWSQVSLNCPSVQYHIVASNCGECPDTTTTYEVICTGNYTQLINNRQCLFAVQAGVCNDSIVGDVSTPVNVAKNETGT